MLVLLLNLALIWLFVIVYFMLRGDQFRVVFEYVDHLESEMDALCAQIEDRPLQRRYLDYVNLFEGFAQRYQQLASDVYGVAVESQTLADKMQRLSIWSQQHRAIRQSLATDGATIHMFPELGEQLSVEEAMLRREVVEFPHDFPLDDPSARSSDLAWTAAKLAAQGSTIQANLMTDERLAVLKRQQRTLKWKVYALMVFAYFIKLPFDLVKWLMALFSRKE